MFLTLYTAFHVALSLVGIVSGLVVLRALLASRRLSGWTQLFLWTTVATNLSGFGFPFVRFLPSHAIAIVSLVLLSIAIVAWRHPMVSAWRWIFVVTAVTSLYLNVFVLVVQAFLKVPALREMAPTQTELPFALAQGVVLLAFVALAALAVVKFHPSGDQTTPA